MDAARAHESTLSAWAARNLTLLRRQPGEPASHPSASVLGRRPNRGGARRLGPLGGC